jgi:hypothetical protein
VPSDSADLLPTLVKIETQDAIDSYGELTRTRPRRGTNLHTDSGFAQRTIFGGTVNMGVATAAYCSEVIERAYGPGALLRPGASLEYKGIRPIRADYEITLSGRVLPIGGLKEKVLGAHRAGIKEIILPADNEGDLEDLPQEVKDELTFHTASELGQVLAITLRGARFEGGALSFPGDVDRVGGAGLRH